MVFEQRTRRVFLGQTVAGAAALAAQTPASTSVLPTTTGFLKRPGAEIYYETTGSGPAIVFAHGLGGNHLSWWQQVPYFAKRYTCVTFAHRGFAPSRLESGGPDPALFAGDLAALIDHLKLADVRLVAQSMGGWTCLDYTLRHPDRVRALVMASTSGAVDLNTLDQPGRERVENWSSAKRDAQANLRRRNIHPAAGERMAREQPAMHFLYREIDWLSSAFDKEALRAKLVAARTTPVSALKRLRMPLLFISGNEDVVFPPPAAVALAAAIPGAKLERVPKSGHSVYFERADTFNRLLAAFV
ncbi:MAG TPA: alpha/beta hydrolase [Bryobacteraceae bacterium]|nr:alpha/beta hydrolase [Bryobacteraceae bacterium]